MKINSWPSGSMVCGKCFTNLNNKQCYVRRVLYMQKKIIITISAALICSTFNSLSLFVLQNFSLVAIVFLIAGGLFIFTFESTAFSAKGFVLVGCCYTSH